MKVALYLLLTGFLAPPPNLIIMEATHRHAKRIEQECFNKGGTLVTIQEGCLESHTFCAVRQK